MKEKREGVIRLEILKKISESLNWLSRLPTRWLTRVAGRRVSPLSQSWAPTNWLDKIEICLEAVVCAIGGYQVTSSGVHNTEMVSLPQYAR